MKTLNIVLLQLMIFTSITMSVVETAKFINNPKQVSLQIEEPVIVVKNILKTRDNIQINTKSQPDQEKIFSYNTLLSCWNIIREDQ